MRKLAAFFFGGAAGVLLRSGVLLLRSGVFGLGSLCCGVVFFLLGACFAAGGYGLLRTLTDWYGLCLPFGRHYRFTGKYRRNSMGGGFCRSLLRGGVLGFGALCCGMVCGTSRRGSLML